MTFIGNDVIWCQIDVCSDSRNSLTLRRFGRDVSPDDDDDKLRSKRPTEESFKMLLWWKTFGDVDSDVDVDDARDPEEPEALFSD